MSNLQRIKIGFNVAIGGDPVRLYNRLEAIPLDHIEDASGNTILHDSDTYYNTVNGMNEFTYFLTGDTIGHDAFRNIGENNSPVASIYIYGGVHKLGSYAFAVGNNFSDVVNEVSAIIIEEGVEKIGYNDLEPLTGRTFETITGISAITIPSTVNEIGCNAFYNLTGTTFTFCGSTPTFDMSENGDLGLSPMIYVPAAYLTDYQTALSEYMPNIFPIVPLTNLNIKAAYVGTDEVVKMYLGTDVVWEPAPEPRQQPLKLTFDFPTDGRVKLYASNYDIEDITLEPLGNPLSVDYDGYFTYDPAEISGLHDVYFYFNNDAIYDHQFYNLPNLVAIDIPGEFYEIGSYAFAAESETPSNVTSITLDEGIEILRDRAFEEIRNVSAITIPQSVNYIGTNCFYKFGVYTPVIYTFLNDVPPTFQMEEGNDLGQNSSGIWVFVPCNSKEAYNQATNNRYNGRFVCSYDEIMAETPLTFEITSVGTGETGLIGLRLSGDTSYTNKRPLSYYLNHEGTETNGNLDLREAASNSAITSLISGLTVGDKIEFWGYRDQSGMSVSESAFEYFVTTAGVTAKVYGNVNSLLFPGGFYHGRPVPQTAETAAYAFFRLFHSKTGFTFGAPDELQHIVLPVPANGLQDSIYREMFYGCTNMTTAPELPATTLAANCYRSMFNGCTSLTAATTLPALSVPDYAYLSMFADCPIRQAPALPATTLSQYCYSNMFRGTNITDMPDLPATTLGQNCYQTMFSGCTSLTGVTAVLPALQVEPYCYEYMFAGCTNLTQAPELPATTLAMICYEGMFENCTNLTTAPELPATTLAGNYCYRYMFRNCTSLNYVKALATNPGARYNPSWLTGVASNGTFVKHPDVTWTSGVSGIPEGWTIEDAVIAENNE